MTYYINRPPVQERGPKKDGTKAMILGGLAMAAIGLPLFIDSFPETHFTGNLLPAILQQNEFPAGALLAPGGVTISLIGALRHMYRPVQ